MTRRYESHGPSLFGSQDQRPYDAFPSQSSGRSGGIDQYDLSDMFGQPNYPVKPDTMANIPTTNDPLPSAFRGDRAEIRIVLEDRISTVDLPVATYILPLKRVVDVTKHEWDILTFDRHSLSNVPEESAPALVQSRYTQASAYLERFGLAMKMEHGFMRTEEGRREYRGKLQQITSAAQRFLELRGLAALCNAKNFAYQFQLKNGSATSGRRQELTYQNVIDTEIMNFGALQKEPNALARIVQYGKNIMSSYSIKPNFLLMPESAEMYATHARPEQINFLFSGPNGNPLLSKSSTVPVLPGTGLMVLITRPLATRPDTPAVELLKRWRTVGSFVKQLDNYRTEPGYKSIQRTIIRYNETDNQMQEIRADFMVKYTRRFDQTGKLHPNHQQLAHHLNGQGPDAPQRVVDTDGFYNRGRNVFGDFKAGGLYDSEMDNYTPQTTGVRIGTSLENIDTGVPRSVPASKLKDLFLHWKQDSSNSSEGNDGKWSVCEFIGDMEIPYTTHRDIHMAASSILDQLNLTPDNTRDLVDGLALMQEIDSAEPTAKYLNAMYTNGAAAGNPLDAKVPPIGYTANMSAGENGLYQVFTLPDSNGMTRPFGYGNFRGMRYLASLATGASVKGFSPEVFARASKFMTAFDHYYSRLRSLVGESPYFRPDLNLAYNSVNFDSDILNSKSNLFDHIFKSFGGCLFFRHGGKDEKKATVVSDDLKSDGDWDAAFAKFADVVVGRINPPESKSADPSRVTEAHKQTVIDLVGQISEEYRRRTGGNVNALTIKQWDDDMVNITKVTNQRWLEIDPKLAAPVGISTLKAFLAAVSKSTFSPVVPARQRQVDASAGDGGVWVSTTMTHPSTIRAIPAESANLVALSDLNSVHFMKPLIGKDNPRNLVSDSFSTRPLRDLGWTGMKLSSARSAELTALHTTSLVDHVGLKYRSESSAGNSGDDGGNSRVRLASTAGLINDQSSKRARTETGARARFAVSSLDDSSMDDDDNYPFWTDKPDKKTPNYSSMQPPGAGFTVLGGSVFATNNMRARFREIESEPNDLVRACAHIYITLPIRATIFTNLIEHDIRVPFSALWCNPSVRRRTDSAILGVTGDQTGATLWGYSVFEIGDDSRIGVHWGTYTVYSNSVIYDERKLMMIRDFSFVGYGGGGGGTFITSNDQYVPTGDHLADIMGFMIPLAQDKLPSRLDITGKYQMSAVGADLYSKLVGNDRDHYASAPYYRVVYDGFNVRQDNMASGPFFSDLEKNNTLVIADFQQDYEKHTGAFTKIVDNQGHAGPTFINCNQYRNGAPLPFPKHSWDPSSRQQQLVP